MFTNEMKIKRWFRKRLLLKQMQKEWAQRERDQAQKIEFARRCIFSIGAVAAAAAAGVALGPRLALADTAFTNFSFNATSGTNPQTMPARLSEIRDVVDFGADPTGTNDSQPAVMAAIAATAGLNRGVIFFPPGTYKFNSAVTDTDDGLHSIIFRGVGNLSNITANFAGYCFDRDFAYHATNGPDVFENLRITNQNALGGCIRWENTIGVNIRDCYLTGYRCITFGTTAGSPSDSSESISISDVIFSSLAGVTLGDGSWAIAVGANFIISGCDLAHFDNGIRVYAIGGLITGCRIETCGVGIRLGVDNQGGNRGLSACMICGGSLESCGTAIDFASGSGNVFITGLSIIGNPGVVLGGGNPQYGVNMQDGGKAHDSTLSDCSISGLFEQYCVYVGDGASVKPIDNANLVLHGVNVSNTGVGAGSGFRLPTKAGSATFIQCVDKSDGVNGTIPLPVFTFANLPNPATEGQEFSISNSNTTTWGAAVGAGSPGSHAKVRYNGTGWTVIGI